MTCYRFLSFASFLLLLQSSWSFAPYRGRTGSLVSEAGIKSKRDTATRLNAFSSTGMNLRSVFFSKSVTEDHQSSRYSHRHSASDWLHNVQSIKHSTVLRDIRNPVLTVTFWGTLVSVFHRLLTFSSNPLVKKMSHDMCLSSTPHSFLVSSLGLLLVFRTNSAYQRFAEGRKIWENILTVSRNLSRMVNLYDKEIGSRKRKQRILNLTAAFPYLLRHHIREGCLCEDPEKTTIPQEHRLLLDPPPVSPVDTRHEGDKSRNGQLQSSIWRKPCWVDTRNFPWSLLQGSLDHCARAQNRPLWVCDRIGKEIMGIAYNDNFSSRERLALLGQVDKLSNSIGECERIHQTAVPLNYARHSLRSLTIWLLTLPFSLIKDMGLLTGPVMGVIAWLLFGVYQIGYSIEDPFQGSLRLSILCDAIRRDVLGDGGSRATAFSNNDRKTEVPEFDDFADLLPTEGLIQMPVAANKSGSRSVL